MVLTRVNCGVFVINNLAFVFEMPILGEVEILGQRLPRPVPPQLALPLLIQQVLILLDIRILVGIVGR